MRFLSGDRWRGLSLWSVDALIPVKPIERIRMCWHYFNRLFKWLKHQFHGNCCICIRRYFRAVTDFFFFCLLSFFFLFCYPYWNFSRLILGHIEIFIESLGKMKAERDLLAADNFIVKCRTMCLIFSVCFIGCPDVLRAPKPSCSAGDCRPLDLPHCGSLGFLRKRRVKAIAHSRQETRYKPSSSFATRVVKELKAFISEFVVCYLEVNKTHLNSWAARWRSG